MNGLLGTLHIIELQLTLPLPKDSFNQDIRVGWQLDRDVCEITHEVKEGDFVHMFISSGHYIATANTSLLLARTVLCVPRDVHRGCMSYMYVACIVICLEPRSLLAVTV